MFKKKSNPTSLDAFQLECIIEALYRTLTYIPREIAPALGFTLSGINLFCSGYVAAKKQLTEKQVRKLMVISSSLTIEHFFRKADIELCNTITDRLVEYLFSDWRKEEDSLSYLIRFLNTGGIIYMLYAYKNSLNKSKQLMHVRENVLNALNSGESMSDILKYLPEGLFGTVNTCSKLAFNEYKLIANNKKLNESFPDFDKFE